MVSVKWCKNQQKGISLIERKPHLSKAYLEDAYESLKVCLNSDGKWKVITGYYACYNSLYSILMKCGIKCEIHDCTISLMSLFNFSEKYISFIKSLKKDRIQGQYYLKKVKLTDVLLTKKFILKCEEILNSLKDDEIDKIRGVLNE